MLQLQRLPLAYCLLHCDQVFFRSKSATQHTRVQYDVTVTQLQPHKGYEEGPGGLTEVCLVEVEVAGRFATGADLMGLAGLRFFATFISCASEQRIQTTPRLGPKLFDESLS